MQRSSQKSIVNSQIGEKTVIWDFVNIYGAKIGKNCKIGAFVEIQEDVEIGDFTKISSHSFICSKARIGNNCFIGHGVIFVSDLYPPSDKTEWRPIIIENHVRIGSNATILCKRIGFNSLIGAGSVVVEDVPANTIVAGNPAKILRKIK